MKVESISKVLRFSFRFLRSQYRHVTAVCTSNQVLKRRTVPQIVMDPNFVWTTDRDHKWNLCGNRAITPHFRWFFSVLYLIWLAIQHSGVASVGMPFLVFLETRDRFKNLLHHHNLLSKLKVEISDFLVDFSIAAGYITCIKLHSRDRNELGTYSITVIPSRVGFHKLEVYYDNEKKQILSGQSIDVKVIPGKAFGWIQEDRQSRFDRTVDDNIIYKVCCFFWFAHLFSFLPEIISEKENRSKGLLYARISQPSIHWKRYLRLFCLNRHLKRLFDLTLTCQAFWARARLSNNPFIFGALLIAVGGSWRIRITISCTNSWSL